MLRIETLQKKGDTDGDENKCPDPMCADVDHAHCRGQEQGSSDQK